MSIIMYPLANASWDQSGGKLSVAVNWNAEYSQTTVAGKIVEDKNTNFAVTRPAVMMNGYCYALSQDFPAEGSRFRSAPAVRVRGSHWAWTRWPDFGGILPFFWVNPTLECWIKARQVIYHGGRIATGAWVEQTLLSVVDRPVHLQEGTDKTFSVPAVSFDLDRTNPNALIVAIEAQMIYLQRGQSILWFTAVEGRDFQVRFRRFFIDRV